MIIFFIGTQINGQTKNVSEIIGTAHLKLKEEQEKIYFEEVECNSYSKT